MELKLNLDYHKFYFPFPFNRTILELKRGGHRTIESQTGSFNRTILELKHGADLYFRVGNVTFNRTILELKHTKR